MSTTLQNKIIDALLDEGIQIGDFIERINARQSQLQNEMCEAAEPSDGVEVDAVTMTSAAGDREIIDNEGTYVLAWVWVALEEKGAPVGIRMVTRT